MVARTAVVVGSGIGGLAAAVALSRAGWEVRILERASHQPVAGAALSLWPNAIRALRALGLADRVLAAAAPAGRGGVRRPDGRWIARSDLGQAIARRFGDPLVLVPRRDLVDALVAALPAGAREFGVEVSHLPVEADLVVAADGAHSRSRRTLFPAHPGLTYAGYTSWRFLAAAPPGGIEPAETWGPDGMRFATVPLAGDRLYCYATATAPPGERADGDERAELLRRFGDWHSPIPSVLASIRPVDVVRTDVVHLAERLPALHAGNVALLGDAAHAMTPDLGQGACQALEDAVTLAACLADGTAPNLVTTQGLARYTALRLPRTSAIVARSRRAGSLYEGPPQLARAAARVINLLPAGLLARGMAGTLDWRPPSESG